MGVLRPVASMAILAAAILAGPGLAPDALPAAPDQAQVDLTGVPAADWEKTVEGIQPGNRIAIDGAAFQVIRALSDEHMPNARTFLVQREDVSRPERTVLKILKKTRPHSNLPHWKLPVEKRQIEIQGAHIRAPAVHFLAANQLVMEKEFIEGALLWEWAGQSRSTTQLPSVRKMFALLRLDSALERLGLYFTDLHAGNVVFDAKTEEWVVFDGGMVERSPPPGTAGHPPGLRLKEALISNPATYFMWRTAEHYAATLGHGDAAYRKTAEVLKDLGDDVPSIFNSIYGLNDFGKKHPDVYEHLLKAASGKALEIFRDEAAVRRLQESKLVGQSGRIGAVSSFDFWLAKALREESIPPDLRLEVFDRVHRYQLPGTETLDREGLGRARILRMRLLRLARGCVGRAFRRLSGDRPRGIPAPRS